MSKKFGEGLLAVSVMCGPAFWLLAVVASFSAWQAGINDGMSALKLLAMSLFFMCWALWGIVSGPLRVRYWWFGFSSLLNIVVGGWLVTTDYPHHGLLALPFLAYSLWQAHVFEQLRSERNS